MKTLFVLALLFVSTTAFAQWGCQQYFRIGDKVLSINNVKGKIVNQYNGHQFMVKFETSRRPMEQAAMHLAHLKGVCKGLSPGLKVIDPNGSPGKVFGFFDNGKIVVDFDSSHEFGHYEAEDLALTSVSTSEFWVGQKVRSMNGVRGVVMGFYPDGTLSVRFNNARIYTKQDPTYLVLGQ